MNKKIWAVLFTLFVALLFAVPVFAYYSTISGQLRDSKTGAIWTSGASIEVFNCNTLATINTSLVGVTGVFTIDISSIVSATPVCVEVTFNNGGNGTPGNAAKGPFTDRVGNAGNLDSGVYFTGTGPTAVVLKEVTAQPSVSNIWLPVALLGIVIVAGSFWALRKRQQA